MKALKVVAAACLTLCLSFAGCSRPGPASPVVTAESEVAHSAEQVPLTPIDDQVGRSEKLRVYLKDKRTVAVEVLHEGGRLLRSTSPFDLEDAPMTELPRESAVVVDREVADGVSYYYGLFDDKELISMAEVRVPPLELPQLERPRIVIDKTQFTLSVFDGERLAKRYPVALGRRPANRKLHYDMASTPEGEYTIINLQPQATYYRAYDIDYPNRVDQFRYQFAQEHQKIGDPGIGGEIQIHGRGIAFNWTGGCIALRDEDMDELFAHPEISTGTPVLILGQNLGSDDLESIRGADSRAVGERLVKLGYLDEVQPSLSTRRAMSALGRFQLDRRLPLTCQADARTLEALRRHE